MADRQGFVWEETLKAVSQNTARQPIAEVQVAETTAGTDRDTDTPSIRASLLVRGFDGDPQQITQIVGRSPTRFGRPGDQLVGPTGRATNRTVRQNFWALQSRADPYAPLATHVADIVQQVGDAKSAFARLPKGCTVAILCTIIPEGGLPVLSLDAASMRALSEIGAELELDVISADGPA